MPTESLSMCPHCGRLYQFSALIAGRLIPTHDYPPPCRSVCPGSGQNPRNPESDNRPLWSGESLAPDWTLVGNVPNE